MIHPVIRYNLSVSRGYLIWKFLTVIVFLKFTLSVLNRAAKILNKFNNFRTSYFQPGSVLDKYKVIDDKKVKNKKEIYIDKQPSIKIKEDNWLEEALKNLRKEREKELKHIMKSEIFSGNSLVINKTVDWSKEYNANFVVEMLSRYNCENFEYMLQI
ncbi:unnamed protein product [Meloidogyne enterolobii]|uniref:Uncharacterized protein n=1 Tax=Meloidogyne enterolobii TaxID=390850 RepID=A0ACB1AGX1_MELEN